MLVVVVVVDDVVVVVVVVVVDVDDDDDDDDDVISSVFKMSESIRRGQLSMGIWVVMGGVGSGMEDGVMRVEG